MLGWVLVLECSFISRITLEVLMIQGGVCGKVLSYILSSGIFYYCRVDFIRRPKGFIVFFFSFKMLLVLRVEGAFISWLDGQDFSFVEYWRASFSRLSADLMKTIRILFVNLIFCRNNNNNNNTCTTQHLS